MTSSKLGWSGIFALSLAIVWAGACSWSEEGDGLSPAHASAQSELHTRRADPPPNGQAAAVFAGGCFWCMETAFEGLRGVESVTSGYAGGRIDGPSYEQVSAGGTGHAESVRVVYHPDVITYAQLLDIFWHNVDPTQRDGQFCDHGNQYRTAIFVANAEERRLAEASRARAAEELHRDIVTEIDDAAPFWIAEDYHQDFFRTHPVRYRTYRTGCGRDRRLEALWGAPGRQGH
ncbi:MAG: peptide-methionine (S)-S-oxide reductase MsrA [Sandaracinaceae bacterium]